LACAEVDPSSATLQLRALLRNSRKTERGGQCCLAEMRVPPHPLPASKQLLWLIDWLKWRGIGAIHKTGAKCRFVHPWRLPVTRSQKMPVKGVLVLKPEDLITGCPFLIEAPARRISVPERPPVRQGRFLQHSAQFPAFERIHQQRDLITRLEFVEFPPNPLKYVRTGALNRIVLDSAGEGCRSLPYLDAKEHARAIHLHGQVLGLPAVGTFRLDGCVLGQGHDRRYHSSLAGRNVELASGARMSCG
jgi:hypothetical protein